MRGDRPARQGLRRAVGWATPHARGSTCQPCLLSELAHGYPACAGIDLTDLPVWLQEIRLPRMRGDRPRGMLVFSMWLTATPHARGSTLRAVWAYARISGYPACAGIDLR